MGVQILITSFEVSVLGRFPCDQCYIIHLLGVFVNKVGFELDNSFVIWLILADIRKIEGRNSLPSGTNELGEIS